MFVHPVLRDVPLQSYVLSIFLRQRGSPESKPVHAPHSQTGHESGGVS